MVRAVTGGSGGASSPEAAVEDLAAALEEEDPVAALATMDPDEVEALGDVYESAAARAEAIGFAPDAAALGGVDIALSGLRYDVDELGDGVAKVTVSGGADLTVTRDELGGRTEAVVERLAEEDGEEPEDRLEGELEDEDLVVTDDEGDEVDPFVVTVRRGGGWYVSPLHTAAQYGVEALGLDAPSLPPPDAGDAGRGPRGRGPRAAGGGGRRRRRGHRRARRRRGGRGRPLLLRCAGGPGRASSETTPRPRSRCSRPTSPSGRPGGSGSPSPASRAPSPTPTRTTASRWPP